MKGKVLKKDFYEQSTFVVARALLGKYLVTRYKGKIYPYMITEVEIYDGRADLASHAARGMTPRNKIMYGDAGVWYVYLVYGIHEMLNIVTRKRGYPAGVLIRGVEGISGPGRVTKALHVTRDVNGKKAEKNSGLWIEDRGVRVIKTKVVRTPRVGVIYAGEYWAKKKWRLVYNYPPKA